MPHAAANISEPDDEGTILSGIVNWSQQRCAWQRDALRRLCQSGSLSQQDIDELAAICKGQIEANNPITLDHIRNPQASANRVELKSIADVRNVNALASDQKLRFSPTGLTVVYGDNGSGKSGYTRILKQICRARNPRSSSILGNIYNGQTEPLKAQISYVVAGQNHSNEWTKDQPMDSILSSVSVFDANTASVHVDATNDVAYIPYAMSLLSKLAEACKSIKTTLDAEKLVLTGQTPASLRNPACSATTQVGRLIANLKGNTDLQLIESLSSVSADEERRLDELRVDLSMDPATITGQLNAKLRRLTQLSSKGDQLSSAINEAQHAKLLKLKADHTVRKEAAEIAASALFNDDPLTEVGGSAWKALWEAARQYSAVVYPDQDYPVTDENAHCLLCQQEIQAEAAERMNRFEAFITDETKQQEQKTLNDYIKHRTLLAGAPPSKEEIDQAINFCLEELGNEQLGKIIRSFFVKGKWRLRAILNLLPLPEMPVWPMQAINLEKDQITNRLSNLASPDATATRQNLLAEKNELEDRKWLQSVKDDVVAEVVRKGRIEHLDSLIRQDTATAQITAKSTIISESLVTNALRTQFALEVNKMKLAGLAVELKQETSSYGVPQFRVALTRNPSVKVGNILSEGEFRCIALAAFMAELATTRSQSAIVFDDPVSSLDHMHREAVADRLASEANVRQVIVFTHDIHFLFLLDRHCISNGAGIHYRHVTKRPDGTAGLCHDDAPPKAQNVDKCIQSIQSRLTNEKIHHERGNETDWHRTVLSLQRDMRSTWERAVEDVISPVLTRFSNDVKTPGLSSLTVITEDDCRIMRDAFKRCSEWMHSSGIGLNSNIPTPALIQQEIDALRAWYQGMLQKQDAQRRRNAA